MNKLGWIAGLLLSPWVLAQDPPEQSPKEEVAKAAKETGKLDSYTFKVEIDVQGGPGGAMGERPPVEGRYNKDEGLYVKIGDYLEVARKGKKLAIKRPDGDWEEFKPRGGGGGGGGDPAPGAGQMEDYFAQIKAPHEEMEGFEKRFKTIEKTSETDRIGKEDARLYKGGLTDQGVKDSLPFKGLMDGILQWIPNAQLSGSAKAWIGENGRILKYEVVTTISGDFNGNEFTVDFTRTIVLSDLNEAKAEIPEEAKKVIETESAKPKEDKKPEEKK